MQKLNWNYYVSVILTHIARLFLPCNVLGVMSLGLCERLHVALTARHYGGTNTWEADVTQSHTDTVLHFIHLIPPSAQ